MLTLATKQYDHDQHPTTDKPGRIACVVRPEVGQEWNVTISRYTVGDRTNKKHPSICRANPTNKSGDHSESKRERHQRQQWANEIFRLAFRPASEATCTCQWDANNHANPPSRNDAPAESQQGGIVRAENRRVTDGEVFNANPSRDLIVDDAVSDTRGNRQEDNRDRLHMLPHISSSRHRVAKRGMLANSYKAAFPFYLWKRRSDNLISASNAD